MKNLSTYIFEGKAGRAVIPHFNHKQEVLIWRHIKDVNITFDLDGHDIKNVEIYSKGKYPYIQFDSKSSMSGSSPYKHFDGMIIVGNNYINLGPLHLYVDTSNYRNSNTCNLVEFTYSGGKTKCVFELYFPDSSVSSFLKGKVILEFPCDLVNAKGDFSKFDCKGYDKFMEKHLPAKVEYHRPIDLDDIVYWESSIQNNKLYIFVQLECGKGYSSHSRRVDYNCSLHGPSYRCDRPLYDRDSEAQIVRKFLNGIGEFLKMDISKMPENVTVTIFQELD